jgi:hypothetical protein
MSLPLVAEGCRTPILLIVAANQVKRHHQIPVKLIASHACARGTTRGPGFVTGDQWKIALRGLTLG